MSSLIRRRGGRRGFTMIELLTVIGIIVILMSILIPIISTIRRIARNTDTTHLLTKIATACNNYYSEFRGYPGPLPDTAVHGYNLDLSSDKPGTPSPGFAAAFTTPTVYSNITPGATFTDVTSTQNLVLGLCGGMIVNPSVVASGAPYFDVTLIPKGPRILNPLASQQFPSYIDPAQNDISTDGVGNYSTVALMGANPTPPPATFAPAGTYALPEFMDHYSEPHAIVYLRARPGAQNACDVPSAVSASGVVSLGSQYYSAEMMPYAPYFYSQQDRYNNFITAYTAQTTTNGYGLSFFTNQALDNGSNIVPRGKDSFILISAGYDGLYGTKDDIVYPPQNQ